MQLLVPILITLLALLVALAIAKVAHDQGRGKHLLDRIARRFNGKIITPKGALPYVLVRFHKTPFRITLSQNAETKKDFLSIAAPIRSPDLKPEDAKFRMSLTLERLQKKWQKFAREDDLEVGNPEFDDRFFVRSNEKKKALSVLTSEAQLLILKIYRSSSFVKKKGKFSLHSFELRITENQLQLDKGIDVGIVSKVFMVVRAFGDLHKVLVESTLVAAAIEIDRVFSGDTVCLICGEVVSKPKVTCKSCLTEYHHECWQYVGSCGRYACGETHYTIYDDQEDPDVELFRIDQ